MSAQSDLTAELRRQVSILEDDLRRRVEPEPRSRVDPQQGVLQAWQAEHAAAVKQERTAATWAAWRDERVTQAAVAWVLTTVFIRFCEDNGLVKPVWIAGPPQRRQEAWDGQRAYFREHPLHTDREWIKQGIAYLASLPATRDLVDERSALHLVSPSGDAAAALLAFWRETNEQGSLVHDLADPSLSTRFLGDVYQDISESARSTYALLQTPVFVEEFILDRTLEPALSERPLDGFRMIDPTCGSGHFLLGAFARLLDRWNRESPGLETQARVQQALNAVHGVDVNPFAVAIARFRLTLAAMQACGLTKFESAPAFDYHLAAGDSLWFGAPQQTFDYENDTDLAGMANFAYHYEDRATLRQILRPGRYDAVVGNPPYITVKDKALNAAYRVMYEACKGPYAMTVPFMELFFKLTTPGSDVRSAGWTGQITSNSFMKREFGAPLIEKFLVKQDLRLVVDTSGAYIPGHGTPTVIIVGCHRRPVGPTVRAVLGIRGEPGRPDNPAKGIVWRSIVEHVDQPGHDDGWTSTADLDRTLLAHHPWSLTGGGAIELTDTITTASRRELGDAVNEIGRTTHTGADECYFVPGSSITSHHLNDSCVPVVLGEDVRDYRLAPNNWTVFPYDSCGEPIELGAPAMRHLWRTRRYLQTQIDFGQTKAERGLRWIDYSMFFPKRFRSPLSISFAFVSTHNHFVLDRGGKVFKQSSPVIKLPEGATEDEHLALLGVLNSSTACFWLKQNSHDKGNGGIGGGIADQEWERFYEFTGTTLQDYPLPGALPLVRGRLLDGLASKLAADSSEAIVSKDVATRGNLDSAREQSDRIRAEMVSVQEELDWETYRLYGLIDEDLTHRDEHLPELALGERAFEIALARRVAAGEESTAWFDRHGSTPITEIPSKWPIEYQRLVQRRLDLIESDRSIRLLEKPEYKRRWGSESWEKQEKRALRGWLLDRLEDKRFWFDNQGRPAPRSVGQLADDVARDADLMSVLALWEGRPDVSTTASLTKLLVDEAVPFLAAYRYKEAGLRKRADWEATWALQRREDAGETLPAPIPVPPKYATADFVKTSYWSARGKLDVPKERFIAYHNAGRDTDPTPMLGWAGWDHAQQALALNTLINQREQDGWQANKLSH